MRPFRQLPVLVKKKDINQKQTTPHQLSTITSLNPSAANIASSYFSGFEPNYPIMPALRLDDVDFLRPVNPHSDIEPYEDFFGCSQSN
jgi:hypothetical protein